MNNHYLLEKYRKRLSIYFAMFVLLSLWITQAFFLVVEYIPHNLKMEKNLTKKVDGVKNILENHEKYYEKLNNKDSTLGKVLVKTLENVVILDDCIKGVCNKTVVDHIEEKTDFIYLVDDKFFNKGEYKYIKENFIINNIEYQTIIKTFNEYSFGKGLGSYLYFVLFSLPFIFIFYFIGYKFVGKNFKPINDTISGLEDFTTNINHEMKTPLAEIISTLSLAKKLKNYDEAISQSLDSTKKLNKILDGMLGIVNIVDSEYQKQKFDLVKELKIILNESTKKINKKELIIKEHLSNKSYFLKENKEHFNMCIGNILSNAIKYSYHKGIIEIYFKDGELKIVDYGQGINKKNLKNIFNRYFRENYTKEDGYGIGLSLVKKIVDINGWGIIIKSQKKKSVNGVRGTRVKITFI